FIGTNIARSYLEEDQPVHIFDNLSRPGVEQNLLDLQRDFPGKLEFTGADISNRSEVAKAVASAHTIYHLAAQVAVTTSLEHPLDDLQTNLMGTIHILEAIRRSATPPSLLFTSTNKVYGRLSGIALANRGSRYEPENAWLATTGASEDQPLEFLSPYGCSKGSADQYVLDYARSYGLRATVFRMSCIYGPHQLGSEDQGWVAHFLRQGMKGEPITIYGDGRQVRDLLFVEDLVRAMRLAQEKMSLAAGQAFNVGGGAENSTSLLELIEEMRLLTGNPIEIEWSDERLGDQKWYVADTAKIRHLLAWAPTVSIREGLRALHEWYLERPSLVARAEVQVA
ncbi:MAG: GDP-mannose 4,6-dehydratase, partial [Acidobacteriaceae bacterium]|nr:GDP-mannose 4,6-dehydratase [Acidobacteriaceae bacterium]